jgi:hypothetical protein
MIMHMEEKTRQTKSSNVPWWRKRKSSKNKSGQSSSQAVASPPKKPNNYAFIDSQTLAHVD